MLLGKNKRKKKIKYKKQNENLTERTLVWITHDIKSKPIKINTHNTYYLLPIYGASVCTIIMG